MREHPADGPHIAVRALRRDDERNVAQLDDVARAASPRGHPNACCVACKRNHHAVGHGGRVDAELGEHPCVCPEQNRHAGARAIVPFCAVHRPLVQEPAVGIRSRSPALGSHTDELFEEPRGGARL
eukprot:Amastigsp_a849432_5.p3 type:complete len:126 gc:universal Amastigsp_a849432_5:397-20(-)